MAPNLKRYSHCPLSGEMRYMANECKICDPSSNECEAQQIAANVLIAYERQPIHGNSLVLPNGKVITKDAWQLNLQDILFVLLGKEDPLSAIRAFDLEAWLKSTIEESGTEAQKVQFQQLVEELDKVNQATESAHTGYLSFSNFPELSASDLAHQPYHEVDCVRSAIPVAYRGTDAFEDEQFSDLQGNLDDICFDDGDHTENQYSSFAHLSLDEINQDNDDNDDDLTVSVPFV